MESYSIIAYSIVNFIILILSAVGNLLIVIFALTLKKNEKTVVTLTKCSIALAELGMSVANIAFFIRFEYRVFDEVECTVGNHILIGITSCFVASSLFQISFMALQRLYVMIYPFKYARITKKKQTLYLSAIWILSLTFFVAYVIAKNCVDDKSVSMRTIHWLRLLFADLPYLVTVISSVAMYLVYKKVVISSPVGARSKRPDKAAHDRVVRMTCLMVIGYTLTSGPLFLMTLIYFVSGSLVISQIGMAILYTFFFSTSLVDFAITSVFDDRFKHFLKSITKLRMKNCVRNNQSEEVTRSECVSYITIKQTREL